MRDAFSLVLFAGAFLFLALQCSALFVPVAKPVRPAAPFAVSFEELDPASRAALVRRARMSWQLRSLARRVGAAENDDILRDPVPEPPEPLPCAFEAEPVCLPAVAPDFRAFAVPHAVVRTPRAVPPKRRDAARDPALMSIGNYESIREKP